MDRSHWMYKVKRDEKYVECLKEFKKVAEQNRVNKGESHVWCSCRDCKNCQKFDFVIVEEHLIIRGFMRGYTCWSRHGETLVDHDTGVLDLNGENDDPTNEKSDNLSEMLLDCEDDVADEDYEKFQDLLDDSEKPLYDGCEKYTKLYAVLKFQDLLDDMVEMGIRPELAPIESPGKRTYLPVACYTMSKAEKTKFCKCLHGVKVPSGYSANIKKLVSLKELKLLGMKSHDCHVLMTHMIPIALRGILPDRIRHTITKLCLFFNMIHSKVINPDVLDSWQSDIIVTLCQLEMYFPPSFFDVMVHLISHIVNEIKFCGPVFLRYMYPFERYMGVLKGYVRNRYRLEGSIVEGYATEEVIEYCTDYQQGVTSIGIPRSRHEGRLGGVGTIGLKMVVPNREDLQLAHFTVLQHMTIIAPYINEHKTMLQMPNRGRSKKWLITEHNNTFSQWLKDKVKASYDLESMDQIVIDLGSGPEHLVATYQGYDISGYTFYTNQQDQKSTLQNSGVTLIASTELSKDTRDARSRIAKESYYGVIQEIWELKYDSIIIPMFKYKWVHNQHGVKVDNDGFTIVDLSTNAYASEPFILAKQATQVFYVEDPKDSRKHIVMHSKRHILGVDNVVDEEEYDQFDELPPFSIGIPSSNEDIDDTTYLRSDHEEGLWISQTRILEGQTVTKYITTNNNEDT